MEIIDRHKTALSVIDLVLRTRTMGGIGEPVLRKIRVLVIDTINYLQELKPKKVEQPELTPDEIAGIFGAKEVE